MLIDLKPNLHRLSAVSLLAVALTLSACKAPPSSTTTPALPSPPEITSGYRNAVALMTDGQHQAEHGLALAAEAGTVIVEIQDGAKKVVDAVSQFANQLST